MANRRQRIHELLLALLARQADLELLEGPGAGPAGMPPNADPGSWLDRNRRVMQRYQALVRTAVTLETRGELKAPWRGAAVSASCWACRPSPGCPLGRGAAKGVP